MIKDSILSPILIVADASESAVPNWDLTANSIFSLITNLPAGSVHGIAYLGTQLIFPIARWSAKQEISTEAEYRGSFIGPVFAALSQQIKVSTIVIIGTGEIFDLSEWAFIRSDLQWILIQTGEASLQPPGCHISEIIVNKESDLAELTNKLSSVLLARSFSKPPYRVPLLGRSLPTRWELDSTGYPMLYVPPIHSFVHFFPVTKSQFESFLASRHSRDYGDLWYSHLLADGTSRGSIMTFPKTGLESLFITGLQLEEVLTYASWSGAGMRIPTVNEWKSIWEWLGGYPDCAPPVDVEEKMTPAALHLWQAVLAQRRPQSVRDLACLSNCIWEWAVDSQGKWMGMGKRSSHPFHNPLEPISPPDPDARPRWFGFRLLRNA